MGEFVKADPDKLTPHVKMILPSGRSVRRDPESGARIEGYELNQVREIPLMREHLAITNPGNLVEGGHFLAHLEYLRKEKQMQFAGIYNVPADNLFVKKLAKALGEPVPLPGAEPKVKKEKA